MIHGIVKIRINLHALNAGFQNFCKYSCIAKASRVNRTIPLFTKECKDIERTHERGKEREDE